MGVLIGLDLSSTLLLLLLQMPGKCKPFSGNTSKRTFDHVRDHSFTGCWASGEHAKDHRGHGRKVDDLLATNIWKIRALIISVFVAGRYVAVFVARLIYVGICKNQQVESCDF